jgi:hypothetical protein
LFFLQGTATASATEAQLSALRAEKDQLIEELTAEKERLLQQMEQLQNVIAVSTCVEC